MGKPEIIGYQADPLNWSAPSLPSISIDADGLWVERNGTRRHLPPESVDEFYLRHGYKRVYKPREFHAKPAYGGYRIHCRTCDTTTLTSGYLPHDSAKMHAEREHHYSTTWS